MWNWTILGGYDTIEQSYILLILLSHTTCVNMSKGEPSLKETQFNQMDENSKVITFSFLLIFFV